MTTNRVAGVERHESPVVHLAEGGRVPICVAIADAGRARLFVLAEQDVPGTAASIPILREVSDLRSPDRRQRGRNDVIDAAPTGGRTTNQPMVTAPNQRAGHLADVDHKFAREIVTALTALVGEHGATRALVVASPKMLGMIRPLTAALRQHGIQVDDTALDLTDESPTELHDHLASRGLLPVRHRLHGNAR